MYTPRRFHIFMRRTTPFEPLEPMTPLNLFRTQSQDSTPHELPLYHKKTS